MVPGTSHWVTRARRRRERGRRMRRRLLGRGAESPAVSGRIPEPPVPSRAYLRSTPGVGERRFSDGEPSRVNAWSRGAGHACLAVQGPAGTDGPRTPEPGRQRSGGDAPQAHGAVGLAPRHRCPVRAEDRVADIEVVVDLVAE